MPNVLDKSGRVDLMRREENLNVLRLFYTGYCSRHFTRGTSTSG